MYSRDASARRIRSWGSIVLSSWRALRSVNSPRSSYGTPSSSQITIDGTGRAKSATSSAGGPAFSIASRCSVTISSTRGTRRFIRLTVNSPVSIRRSRVWSGGSCPSRLPAWRRRNSAVSRPAATSAGGAGTPSRRKRSGSPCSSRTSA